jgi:magnesium transporter
MRDEEMSVVESLNTTYTRSYPGEVAAALESLEPEAAARFLEGREPQAAAAVLERLTPDLGREVLEHWDDAVAAPILSALDPASAAPRLARVGEEQRERLLAALPSALAGEIRELVRYPADSAGGLMDPRVSAFRPETTVQDVLEQLRAHRSRRDQVVYIVDPAGRLTGAATVQDVALALPADRVGDRVRREPARVQATAGREEVIEAFGERRVPSLPVVDLDGHLVGVIRHAALVEAAQEEASVDMQTMVGASRDERALSPPFFAVRKRLPWLQINLLTAFLAASVVGLFEQTIAKFTALAVLLPVGAGQSGNTGSQALVVTMRGLALREVRVRHWMRVASKEITAAFVNGVAVAVTTALGVYLWSHSLGLTLVIGLSMVLSMTLAGLSGAVVPMALTALGQDPAQSSSIILTTVTDVVGFFSFLGIATLLAFML